MLKAILLAAIEVFKGYLHKNEVHVTSDAQCFFEKHFADAHAPDLADKAVTTLTRADVEKHIADGVLEAAEGALTNDTTLNPDSAAINTGAGDTNGGAAPKVPAPAKVKAPKAVKAAAPAKAAKGKAGKAKSADLKPAVETPAADATQAAPAADATQAAPPAEPQA